MCVYVSVSVRVIEKARESARNLHKNKTLELCAVGTGSYR